MDHAADFVGGGDLLHGPVGSRAAGANGLRPYRGLLEHKAKLAQDRKFPDGPALAIGRLQEPIDYALDIERRKTVDYAKAAERTPDALLG